MEPNLSVLDKGFLVIPPPEGTKYEMLNLDCWY